MLEYSTCTHAPPTHPHTHCAYMLIHAYLIHRLRTYQTKFLPYSAAMTTILLKYLKSDFDINSYQIDIKFPIKSKDEIMATIKENLRLPLYYVASMMDHLSCVCVCVCACVCVL